MKRTSCSSRATSLLVVTVLLALAAPNARPVDLGDAAPAINASEWIKDGPVTVAPGGKILVIDFWNTTAPCRYTVPYVNNLQKQFSNRGVQFVGITSESSAKARKFLDSLGTPIEYPMAIDKGTATSRAYLSGMSGELPHAFVISPERKIVWHGNATVALEQVLNEVIAGKFTAESAKRTITA